MESEFISVETDFSKPVLVKNNQIRSIDDEPETLLVKVHSCSVNPSDTYMSRGVYGKVEGKETVGVGFEGAGEIIQVSKDLDPSLVGKKVALSNNYGAPGYEGTWRQYIHVKKELLMFYPDEADYDLMSYSYVNPLTVCCFQFLIEKHGYKAAIQDGAASSLGKMFVKLCNQLGVQTINIVRKDQQLKDLQEIGAEHVLNSESETFGEDLAALIAELKPEAYFDCVGGKLAQNVFFKMPQFSTLYIYGDLSGEEMSFTNRLMIGGRKFIEAIFMPAFLRKNMSEEDRQKYFEIVTKDIAEGGKIFGSKIVKTYPLTQFEEAITESRKIASDGKIVLKPFE